MDPCPECGAKDRTLDPKRDEWTCNVCGLVEDAHTVHGAAPPEVEPSSRATKSLGRLEKVQKRSLGISSSERRLRDAVDEARRIAGVMGCPVDVAERAGRMLESARKKGLTQGRDLDALAAAALLASCRMLYLVRTPKDVAAASAADERQIQTAFKALVQGLKIPLPTTSAFQYLNQLATAVELPPTVVGAAERRLQSICGTERAAGKTPIGWAAAALILAARDADETVSVNRMAKAAGVSGSTVTARMDDLRVVLESEATD